MVRSENKYLTLGIWVFDFVQRDGKGREQAGIPLSDVRRRRSPHRSMNNGQRNSPCYRRQERKTEAERKNREVVGREGAAPPAGLELQLGRGAWRTGGRRTGRQHQERRLGQQREEIAKEEMESRGGRKTYSYVASRGPEAGGVHRLVTVQKPLKFFRIR